MNKKVENNREISDIDLIKKILDNKNSFGVLVDRFEQKLRRYIGRISNSNQQDIDDLLQDIFIKIFVNLNNFDRSLSLNAWVYRIAHNLVIDNFRKDSRQIKHGKFDFDDEIFNFQKYEGGILEEIYKKESVQYIQKIMNSLSIKNHEILYLRFIEGYSYKEISDILKKPESNITSILYRAKKEFKQKYEELKK